MNGKNIGAKFFGPFVFEVELKKGKNELVVIVANLLANQLGDPDIRARISKEHPPIENYERYQGIYDGVNHEAGLFGGVSIYPYILDGND
jgi:hypothetical protein